MRWKIQAVAVALCALFGTAGCDNGSPSNVAVGGSGDTVAVGDSAATGDSAGSGADTVAADTATGSSGCTATSKPGPFHGSCNMAKIGLCQELTGSVYADPKIAEPACTKSDGVFSATEHCNADGRIGRCLNACGTPGELYLHYYVLDESTWKPKCEEAGKGLWESK